MPRWEVHLTVSSMALVVIVTGAVLGLYQADPSPKELFSSLAMFRALAFGSAAMILGSVLPDVDGRGKIRWTMAPIMGAFSITPPFIGMSTRGDIADGLTFLYNDGSRLFLLITAASALFLFLPLRHRGFMHSTKAGVVFGLILGAYTWIAASLDLFSGVMICLMGTLGYFWHLSLDGELAL